MGRGAVTMPPSNVNNSNKQIRPMSIGENYQVPAITPNINPGMWQHSQHPLDGANNPVRQNMASSLPALFEEFSQSQASRNMLSKLHHQQQFQNQVMGQVVERPNMYQFRVQSNPYANLRQHPQQQSSLGGYTASNMNVVQQSDQTTLQKSLEAQRGFDPMHPRLQMPAFHQSQNLALVNQLKAGNQSQTMHLGQSQVPEPTSQLELSNSMEWVNQAFQKLLQIKDTYLPDVKMLYNKAIEEMPRATSAEIITRCEKMKKGAEKLLHMLHLSKPELLKFRKERLFQLLDDTSKQCGQIRAMLSHGKRTQQTEASNSQLEAPHMQQRENYYQFNCAPASLQQQQQSLRQPGALSLPESSVSSPKVDASSITNAIPYGNPMRAATQKWASHGNMAPAPPHKGSDHRSLRMVLHPPEGATQHMNMGNPQQQMVASPRNIFGTLDYSVNPMAPTAVMPVSSQNNKPQDQSMKRQKMKQPVQPFLPDKNKQQQMLQKRNDDTNLRRFVGFNQKMPPLAPSCSSPYAGSPQNSQQSSSQLVQKELSSKLSKSGTPPLSTSPSAFPSPLTPLTPSSAPSDYAKSPLTHEESGKLPKTSAAAPSQVPMQDVSQNQLVADEQGLSKSCPQTKSIGLDDKQPSCVKVDPFKRLVEAVKTVSSAAINASLEDFEVVASLTNRTAKHPQYHGNPPKVGCHYLVDEIHDSECEDVGMEHDMDIRSRMKRRLETAIFNNSTTEAEYCTGRTTKRLKTEPNDQLLQEINEVNHKLIEVEVDVINAKEVPRPGFNEGTLIRCSYVPIGLRNTELPNMSKQMFPKLVLELYVAADYPCSPLAVLETIPPGCSAADARALWLKANSKFSLLLRKISQPISVKDMAEAWYVSTREVFVEFAEQMGGGSFSTDFGKWEDGVLAV